MRSQWSTKIVLKNFLFVSFWLGEPPKLGSCSDGRLELTSLLVHSFSNCQNILSNLFYGMKTFFPFGEVFWWVRTLEDLIIFLPFSNCFSFLYTFYCQFKGKDLQSHYWSLWMNHRCHKCPCCWCCKNNISGILVGMFVRNWTIN